MTHIIYMTLYLLQLGLSYSILTYKSYYQWRHLTDNLGDNLVSILWFVKTCFVKTFISVYPYMTFLMASDQNIPSSGPQQCTQITF